MAWVLDCSVALAWGLPDERSARAERFLKDLSASESLWVPSLWWYELSNGLTVARRRHRVADADVERLVELYRALPVQTDDAAGPDLVGRLRGVADTYDLSAYDAAYLELAQRRGLRLATLDRALARAARKAGVDVLGRRVGRSHT